MNEELLKLDNQLCFRLYAVSRKMTRLYQPLLDEFQLTYPQYIIMLVLFEHRTLDFKDLSTIVDLKTGTLTPIIQNLEKAGYHKRVKIKEDARKINVVLTKKGEQLHEQIISVPISLASQLEISEEMYRVLVKELDDLALILNNASIKK